MSDLGTNSQAAPELLVELDRRSRRPLRIQLEEGLREAIRAGRLASGARLPATRALADDLGVSRRLAVDAYAQLLAEGYLVARPGAGTFVSEAAGATPRPARQRHSARLSFDFFPGHPDLASFPRQAWLRAMREALRDAPAHELGYGDARGSSQLRRALAGHLRRVRGVVVDPRNVIVCSGAVHGFVLLVRALGHPHLAVEDPGLPPHRAALLEHGAQLSFLPTDADGARVDDLAGIEASRGSLDGVLVTPAHQSPTGVALSAARRAALLEWAARTDAIVIEDDYDSEFRYDRAPLAALQGLAPDRVVYVGTVSKTLAPALRLGWMVLPPRLVEPIVRQKFLSERGPPTLEQLTLARLMDSGGYDRYLRQARRRYRSRRDALVRAVALHLPGASVSGVAAGLHAIVKLDRAVDGEQLARAAAKVSVGVYPLGFGFAHVRPVHDELVLGYANLSEPAIAEGIRRLAVVLREG